jgi:hypothetical protein
MPCVSDADANNKENDDDDSSRSLALPDPGNRIWRKKQLERIVRRVQENAVGGADYSAGDFVEDTKRACARQAVPFDNDIFNELVR